MILWYNAWFQSLSPVLYSLVHDIVVRYMALLTVICIFYSNRSFFTQNSNWANIFKFIGQRTLDIYMLHFFFIPNLYDMLPWIGRIDMITLQLSISLAITIVIVSICLLNL